MKQFKIVSLALITTLLVTVTSCTKSFLELNPPTSLVPAQALATEADIQVALRGAYAGLRATNLYGRTLMVLGDIMADNTYQSVTNTNRYTLFNNYLYNVTDGDVANPSLLKADENLSPITQTLVSHLLKSNCPVTGQPDWASVQIHYQGRPMDEEGLLRYLIGFRQLGEFHEHCVEKIFCDIKAQCKPEKLSVYARYTRRGGLDINPFRTDFNAAWPNNIRHARQ